MAPPRMTANPIRPARYRPGKAPEAEPSSEGESDEEEEKEAPQAPPGRSAAESTNIVKELRHVNLNEKRAQAAAAEAARIEAEKAALAKEEEDFETEESSGESSEGEDAGGGVDQESSEEESSSEDEAPKVLLRPTFVRKDQRKDTPKASDVKAEEQKWAEEEARRKAQANELVQEQLERNAAARAAGKKNWDDDEEEDADAVDDTDGLDPEAEYAAWKLRELKRVKREREAIEEAEKEREEIERRRALGSEEREAEDAAFIAAQKEAQKERGQASFMQKYFHKGAFFQDDAKEQGLDRRDIMASKFEDQTDRSVLPAYMQIRDMTKLGRKGRTKYKDMKSEDTGQWGVYDGRRGRREGGSGMQGGGDERFQPDWNNGGSGGGRSGPSGANATQVQARKPAPARAEGPAPGSSERDHNPRDERSTYRPSRGTASDSDRYRRRSSSRSDSRSRTPPPREERRRSGGSRERRKRRDASPYTYHDESKRRKVHA